MELGCAPERRVLPASAPSRSAHQWADRRWADREWVDREWTWPPGGALPAAEGTRWGTDEWAPATTVRRPLVRLGRWTLLYRRPGC